MILEATEIRRAHVEVTPTGYIDARGELTPTPITISMTEDNAIIHVYASTFQASQI